MTKPNCVCCICTRQKCPPKSDLWVSTNTLAPTIKASHGEKNGSGIWEFFAESACKLLCWVAMRKPKTSRRKRKPKPRITGIKGCKPAELHAVPDERNPSSMAAPSRPTRTICLKASWCFNRLSISFKNIEQLLNINFLKAEGRKTPRVSTVTLGSNPLPTCCGVAARELHSVKPMTKCKVHLALRAPMPWKAWSCFQHLILHQLIHSIHSQAALETYTCCKWRPRWWITVSQSHGLLLNSNHAVSRRVVRLWFSLLFGNVCRPSIAILLSSTRHLNDQCTMCTYFLHNITVDSVKGHQNFCRCSEGQTHLHLEHARSGREACLKDLSRQSREMNRNSRWADGPEHHTSY